MDTMNRICYLTFLFCCFLPFASAAQAQIYIDQINFPGGTGIGITFASTFDSFFVSTPSLTSFNATIADGIALFEVESGDFVSNNTFNSFTPLVSNIDPSINNLPGLPFGESFIGFATFGSFGSNIDAFGYARILRTTETLEVLASDITTSFSGDTSFGITVPVPEPASALIGSLGLISLVLVRRRH